MIKVDNIDVMNFRASLRGMRNPLESWHLSDSIVGVFNEKDFDSVLDQFRDSWSQKESEDFDNWVYTSGHIQHYNHALEVALIGPRDLALAQKLVLAGPDHSKFMRQIFVSMDISAPLFWYKEMDTYKVGTVANSCSTMHKLATTPITRDCFSFDKELESFDQDLQQYIDEEGGYLTYSETIIRNCENLRQLYLETKDIRYWRALIQLLPSSWNQKRTWTANYAVLRNIYFSRRNHKLKEWAEFCKVIEKLPYAKELICYEKEIK